MSTLKAWYAGQVLRTEEVQRSTHHEVIERLQRELDCGEITYLPTRLAEQVFMANALCIDVVTKGRITSRYNLTRG